MADRSLPKKYFVKSYPLLARAEGAVSESGSIGDTRSVLAFQFKSCIMLTSWVASEDLSLVLETKNYFCIN